MHKRALAWLFIGLFGASCFPTLDQGGSNPPVALQPCNEAANCDDKDQCTVNVCGEKKTCEFEPIEGLAPEQQAGDCMQAFCAQGTLTQNPDDSDLPDDLESCTTDSCVNGSPVHDVLPDNTQCTFGEAAGLCKAGKCTVECSPQKPCNDGNPCTEDTCNASTGTCTFVALDGLPTPGFNPVLGDCSQQICISGKSMAIADDADLPNDNNFCTKDACSNGMPMQSPTNAGAPCMAATGTGVCNATGVCVECNAPEDCPAIVPANPCKQRTCTNNVCGVMDLVGDIPSGAGDCKKTTCGAGGIPAEQIDNSDVPNDNNICTKDVCTNGTPSNPPESMGFSCGGVLTCDGAGQCAGCTTAADCGTSDECKTYACSMGKCQITYAQVGTPVSGQVAGDCRKNVCDTVGNVVSAIDASDVPNDNLECTADSCNPDGSPVNSFIVATTPCSQNGGTVCNGLGACLVRQGEPCVDGMQCITGFCTDGVCCAETCTGECKACNVAGAAGMCTNVLATNDDAPLCTGTNSCDGMGACKRDNGQACGMNAECSSGFCADGVCCNSACNETCKSCNLTGKIGICSPVPSYTVDPTGTMPCLSPYRCDGQGACKGYNGATCTNASECVNANCVDGVCCNNACNQLCMACTNALTGFSSGACKPILNGTDPQNECPAGSCNGNGMCTP